MILAQNLCKYFDGFTAVKDVSLRIENGQIYGLLGPNGAGKTTTLRMLYALLKPSQGKLEIDGIDVVKQPRIAQSKIGVLTDANRLYTRLSARENIAYFGELHGLHKATIKQRIDYFCDLLDMGSIIDRSTQGFSQGERMKVSLARALVHNPNYVILDEPTNGLDVLTTRAVRVLLKQLKAEQKSVLFSSHVMHEVAALCDEIGIIRQGELVCQGPVNQIITDANAEHSNIIELEQAFIHFAYQGGGQQAIRKLSDKTKQ